MTHASLFVVAAKCLWGAIFKCTVRYRSLRHSFPFISSVSEAKKTESRTVIVLYQLFFINVRQVWTDFVKVLNRFTIPTWNYRLNTVAYSHSDLRKGSFTPNVTHVQFLCVQFNSIQFNSIPFNSIQLISVEFNSVQFSSVKFNSI
jgi:hypothetical protein